MVIMIPTGWAKMLRIVAIECLKTSDPSFAYLLGSNKAQVCLDH